MAACSLAVQIAQSTGDVRMCACEQAASGSIGCLHAAGKRRHYRVEFTPADQCTAHPNATAA